MIVSLSVFLRIFCVFLSRQQATLIGSHWVEHNCSPLCEPINTALPSKEHGTHAFVFELSFSIFMHTHMHLTLTNNQLHAQDAIKNDKTITKSLGIVNVDRSSLARVSGAIAKQHGNSGFLSSLQLKLQGSAGQSFACFNIQVRINNE